MLGDQTSEQAARKQGLIALVLDRDGAEWYIELLHDYNVGREVRDIAASDDENYLRQQCESLFGDDDV